MSEDSSPAAGQLGNRVGKYQLRGEIGQGRMGTVYVAYDPTLDRKVAIKVLAPHLVCEPPFVEGFRRELRSAAQLDHPNIVTVHDAGRKEGRCYFVMNYIEGQSLGYVIEKRAPVPAEATFDILRPLAEALDYAHGRGMLHGDIKPGNVIVGADGRVTLTDFAIARAVEGTWLTRWGVVVGTPEYMSPEQAMGQAIDARSDQYSLGVLGYEMLTGRAPFAAESNVQLVHQVVYDPPAPLGELRPDLPAAAVDAMNRVLAKDAAERFGSCSEFVAAFGAGLGLLGERDVVHVPAPIAQAPEAPVVEAEAPAEAVAPIPAPTIEAVDAPEEQPTRAEVKLAAIPVAAPPVAEPATVAGVPSVTAPPAVEGVTVAETEGLEPALPAAEETAPPAEPEAPATASEWVEEETDLVKAAKAAVTPAQVKAEAPAARAPLGIPSVRDEPAGGRRRRARRSAGKTAIPSVKEPESGRRKLPVWARVLIGVAALAIIVGVGGYFAYIYGLLPPFGARGDEYAGGAVGDGTPTPTPVPTPTPAPTPIPIPTMPAEALAPPPDAAVGDTWMRPADAMPMVFVPAGEFAMGSDLGDSDEQPVHAVALDGFWIDETEVTNTQFRWCVESGECTAPTTCDWGAAPFEDATRGSHPVVCVDWAEAQAYCEWAGGRLPTEAEWEFAARGPAASVYPWGDLEPSCNLARYAACEEGTIVASEIPEGASWVGALNMAGNVWEWVADWYTRKYYDGSPGKNPTGPESGVDRVLRGGGWYFDERYMRSAGRYKLPPGQRLDYVGLRCVLEP